MIRNRQFMFKTAEPTNLYGLVSRVYSLRKFNDWSNAILSIRRSSDSATKWVYFDGDTITLNSPVSGSATVIDGSGDLGTWIGSDNAIVLGWNAQTPDNTYDSAKRLTPQFSYEPTFITGGVINTRNGKPELSFNASRMRQTSAMAELAEGNSFSVFTVSANDVSNSIGAVFTNTNTVANRVVQWNDRRTNRACSVVNATGGAVTALLLAQQDSSNQRILTSLVDGTNKNITSYYNGVFQETSANWTGTYTNDWVRVGINSTDNNGIVGTVQEVIIFVGVKSGDDLDAIHDEVNTYYSIY